MSHHFNFSRNTTVLHKIEDELNNEEKKLKHVYKYNYSIIEANLK